MAPRESSGPNEEFISVDDMSGGVQRRSSRFQSKDSEIWTGENVSYKNIGGVGKKLGYAQRASDLTSTTSTSSSSSTTTTSTSTSSSTSTTTSTSTS